MFAPCGGHLGVVQYAFFRVLGLPQPATALSVHSQLAFAQSFNQSIAGDAASDLKLEGLS